MELYWFRAEGGNYLLSLAGEGNIIEKAEAAIADIMSKKPVDYSQFSVQIRERRFSLYFSSRYFRDCSWYDYDEVWDYSSGSVITINGNIKGRSKIRPFSLFTE